LDIRHEGGALRCRIETEEVDVLDVSIGGVRLGVPQHPVKVGDKIHFEMLVENGVTATGTVKVLTPKWMAIEFVRPNFPLLNQVCRHAAGLHGLTSTMGFVRRRTRHPAPAG
jgi:hypothetical protein